MEKMPNASFDYMFVYLATDNEKHIFNSYNRKRAKDDFHLRHNSRLYKRHLFCP